MIVNNSLADLVVTSSGQQLSIEPTAPATTASATESSTDWSPLIDAFTSISKSRQTQAPMVAPTQGMPDWVWMAVPLGAGVLVLTLALASGGRNRRLAGYGRRRRRTRRR